MNVKNQFMEKALSIAFQGIGQTSPNPSVGAVIVKEGREIACGGTSRAGSAHGEVNAVQAAESNGHDLKGADLYVTLEPCCHHGKTPPCTDLIIDRGFKRVYIPLEDPNPVVSGRGVDQLRRAGIEVIFLNDYGEAAFDLIRPFRKMILSGKPHVISKSAMTLDGKIATLMGDSHWISNEYSRFIVHCLRGRVDAVVVGAETFRHDLPRLDVRMNDFSEEVHDFFQGRGVKGFGRKNFYMDSLLGETVGKFNSPLRVVLGISLEFFESRYDYFFRGDYLIFSTHEELKQIKDMNPEYSERIEAMNIVLAGDGGNLVSIDEVLSFLAERGVMSILLEGGGRVNGAFFDGNYIDQFLYFITPKVLGSGRSVIEGKGRETISLASELKDISFYDIEGDLLYCGYGESILEVL